MRFLSISLICGALAACSPSPEETGRNNAASSASAQHLPTVPLVVTHGEGGPPTRLDIEIALTPQQQEIGLMHRTDIAADGGMIFPMLPPRRPSFWMKDTPTALDILFIRTDGSIAKIVANTEPNDMTPVFAEVPVAGVLELRGGAAAALGIDEGDRISWGECTTEREAPVVEADNFCPA